MSSSRQLVIVAGADHSMVDGLASTLRDDAAVRTAYSVDALFEALDDEVDVVLLVPDLAADELDAVLGDLRSRVPACQVGVLDPDTQAGTFEAPPAREGGDGHSLGDAVVGTDPGAVRDAVRHLAARARYRRQLDEYYGLAEERAARYVADDGSDTAAVERLEGQIERLRRELDAQFDDLDGASIFDAALSRSERTLETAEGDEDEAERS